MIIAAGIVSAFWTVTCGGNSWGLRLTNGNVLMTRVPYTPGYGFPVASGLTVEDASRPGISFDVPIVTDGGSGHYYARVPLWLPLALFASMSLMLWGGGRGLQPVQPGFCGSCGYNLTGNVSGKCSECGAAVRAIRPAAISQDPCDRV